MIAAVFNNVTAVAIGPNGNVFVAEDSNNGEGRKSRVVVFHSNGDPPTPLPIKEVPGENNLIFRGIVVGSEEIFVTDYGNDVIRVFGLDGTLLRSIGRGGPGRRCGYLAGPTGLGMFANGDIVVSESKNHRLQVFTQQGAYVNSFGTRRLKDPTHIFVDDRDHVYVTDLKKEGIWVYRKSGHFIGVIRPTEFVCSVGAFPGKKESLLVYQKDRKKFTVCSKADAKWADI